MPRLERGIFWLAAVIWFSHGLCGTGFSREGVGRFTADSDRAHPLADRAHALRGNAAPDALRRLLPGVMMVQDRTRSVRVGIPRRAWERSHPEISSV